MLNIIFNFQINTYNWVGKIGSWTLRCYESLSIIQMIKMTEFIIIFEKNVRPLLPFFRELQDSKILFLKFIKLIIL